MDCPNCGAGAAGNFCANCGGALPSEPEPDLAVAAEVDAAQAHASEVYAEAELERASHATDEDVEVVEALAEAEESGHEAEVVVAAIDAVTEVATAAIDALTEEPAVTEGDHLDLEPDEAAEVAEGALDQHETEHEALQPSQPDDESHDEHVEPITLLAPASTRTATKTTRRSSSWRRHRR